MPLISSGSSSSAGSPRMTTRSTSWALDVTWAPEFAEAGWVMPWTGSDKQQAEAGTLKPALQTALWHNQLVAVPDNSNTQLLWYRSDLVKTPPVTWAQMINDSIQLAREGKPHYIEI